jgi:hypothetical protein
MARWKASAKLPDGGAVDSKYAKPFVLVLSKVLFDATSIRGVPSFAAQTQRWIGALFFLNLLALEVPSTSLLALTQMDYQHWMVARVPVSIDRVFSRALAVQVHDHHRSNT